MTKILFKRFILNITGGTLHALQDIYSTRCHRKAKKISHPSHCLFTPLLSRRWSTGASKLGQRLEIESVSLPITMP
jgi:hypothetical protein